MMRLLPLLLVVLGCVLVQPLAADDPPTVKARVQLYSQWRKLGLSEDQRQRIGKVQSEYRGKIDVLQKQIAELRKQERSKAEAVLTDAQRLRLKELLSGTTGTPDKVERTKPKEK